VLLSHGCSRRAVTASLCDKSLVPLAGWCSAMSGRAAITVLQLCEHINLALAYILDGHIIAIK